MPVVTGDVRRSWRTAVAALVVASPAVAQVTTILSPGGIANGQFGAAVAGVADLNGDLRGDILVGAPNEGQLRSGRVYVIWGTVGISLRTIHAPHIKTDGHFGASVAGVPDVNGDGKGDIIVGAPGVATGTSPVVGSGRAYIFSGFNGALLKVLQSPAMETGGAFGTSVGGIADVNGDGKGDVIVGAPNEDPGASPDDVGRAYIFSGATGALLWKLFPPGPVEDQHFGISVSGVPDVNGDKFGDVIVGSMEPTGVQEGRAHIYSGATGLRLRTVKSAGNEADGLFGFTVSGIPDVNGDELGDVVVGAPGEDPGTSPADAGRAYIYSGATGQFLWKLLPLTAEEDGMFGISVSGVPDLNNDGRGDVIVGALNLDPGTAPTDAGRAYIFSGATGARLFTLFSSTSQLNGHYGAAVAGVPDVNGNGRGDVVVGAPGEMNGGVVTGRAILHRF